MNCKAIGLLLLFFCQAVALQSQVIGKGDGLRFRLYDNDKKLILTDTLGIGFSTFYNCQYDSANTSGNVVGTTDIRFTVIQDGFIEAPYSETYTFNYKTTGITKLTIGSTVIPSGGKLFMVAGKKVPITIEYVDDDGPNDIECDGGLIFQWSYPSLPRLFEGGEFVPVSQLYSGLNTTLPLIERNPDWRANGQIIKNLKVQTVGEDRIAVWSPKKYKYDLYTLEGRLLKRGEVVNGLTLIHINNLAVGVYVLAINNIETFRIIKK